MQYYNTTLRNIEYRLRKFRDILDDELKKEVMRHEEVILDMVRSQLYDEGITGKGVSIMSYEPYAIRTIKRKIKKGQPYDRVTLKDTGAFYDSLYVEFDEKGFYVTSTDDKAKFLLAKYGTSIFRLTDENLSILLREYIRPELAEKLKNRMTNGA